MATITGSNGSDTITGTAGSDTINSGNGDDIVDGGSGSDQINGGSGGDTLIYNVSENIAGGTRDVYTGGAGVDVVLLQLSFAQWTDPAVRAELQRYVQFLTTVKMSMQGEVSNGSASDFMFTFGSSTLTVQMMETLAVSVQPASGGAYIPINYLASLISGVAAGTAIEAGGVSNSNIGAPAVSGDLHADDLNGADDVFQAVAPGAAANYGTYGVTANGVWTYSLNNAHAQVQALAAGDSLSDSITVYSADGSSKIVNITITGSNDAPVVSGALSASAAEGGGSFTLDLLDGASDADNGETGTLNVANVGYSVDGVVGPVPAGVSLVGSTLSVDPASAAFDHLAVGVQSTIVVSYDVVDAQGATVAQSATITITGTNDAPMVTGAVTGNATEDGVSVSLYALGNASDMDDGATLTVVSVPATLPDGVSYDADTRNFTLDPSDAYQGLAQGESAEVTVNYGVSDGIETVAASMVFTVTGTNDAPVLNAAATPALANVLEDAGAPSGVVGTLVSSLVNLNPPAGGLDNVTDADNGALTGIALTSVNAANGTWWYSTNGGANWSAVGAVSNSSALLLQADAETRVYFQPSSNAYGTVSDAVTFRAWDGTSGTAGTKVSAAVNGGSSAFSTAADTASITVSAVNDNPFATGDRIIVSSSTPVTISAGALIANDTDIDGSALTITSVAGMSGLVLNANGTISFTSGAAAGSFQYTVSDGAGGTATASVTVDVRTVTNAGGGDLIDLSAAGAYQASFIDGRGGSDEMAGGAAGDVFIGGAGNDKLIGGAGNDVLRGGAGNDEMDGGAGNEDLLDFSDGSPAINFTLVQSAALTSTSVGGLGNDSYMNMEGVIGTGGADIINGSAGNDIIRGGSGNDTLDGNGGNDLLDFSDGTGAITFTLVNNGTPTAFSATGLGTDTYREFEGVIGTALADTINGSASADELRGGGGNDAINGMAGDDRIVGGTGADTLTGGADNDTFVFNTAPNAVDSVTDFNASGSAASGDLIELSLAAFAGITTAAGSFLSAAEFASSSGGGAMGAMGAAVRVIYDSATGNLYYDSDGLSAANRTLFATLVPDNPADTFDHSDIKVGP